MSRSISASGTLLGPLLGDAAAVEALLLACGVKSLFSGVRCMELAETAELALVFGFAFGYGHAGLLLLAFGVLSRSSCWCGCGSGGGAGCSTGCGCCVKKPRPMASKSPLIAADLLCECPRLYALGPPEDALEPAAGFLAGELPQEAPFAGDGGSTVIIGGVLGVCWCWAPKTAKAG